MQLKKLSFILLALLLAASCKRDPDADVADVVLDIDFKRMDTTLFAAAKRLQGVSDSSVFFEVYKQQLQPEREFLYFLAGLDLFEQQRGLMSDGLRDSMLAVSLGGLLSDPNMYKLLDTIGQHFSGAYSFEKAFLPPLKRYHLLFPEHPLPAVRTHVNGYDPSGIVQQLDQTFISGDGRFFSFGLHYFMGADFPLYSPNIPMYIRRRFSPAYMPVMLARDLADGAVGPPDPGRRPTLLDKMVHEGIKLALLQRLLPHTPDSLLLFYTEKEMAWAWHFEQEVYKELKPRLYETDFLVHRDFLSEKPFSNEFSDQSAPRLGQFIGWRIVVAWLERNGWDKLPELCKMSDYDSLYRAARYKP